MIYKSNINSVLSRLKKVFSNDSQDKLLRSCAQAVLASNLRRIHNDGKDVNLRRIGSYGTRAIYMNAASPIKITAVGKNKKSVFKNGKPHKSRYFKGGYKEYRSLIKKESGFVNLQIRGTTLKANFQMMQSGGKYLIGFMTSKSVDVASGMEQKYGTRIWGISKKDRGICEEIIKNYIKGSA